MSWRDRHYARDEGLGSPQGGGSMVMGGLPRPGKAVKWLLIVNVALYVVELFAYEPLLSALGVFPSCWWQLWRYITFQFLHAQDPFHIFFNMLGLYFLGIPLEQGWGSKRFLVFYLSCGAVAGLAHVVMGQITGFDTGLLGASGGVYAVVLACAVLYPHIQVVLFLFLVPIRVAAAIFLGIAVINVLLGARHGTLMGGGVSDVAHLGGAAAAAVWLWVVPQIGIPRLRLLFARGKGRWERKMRRRAREEAEMDRILRKIHDHGIDSLTLLEKHKLKKATRERRDG